MSGGDRLRAGAGMLLLGWGTALLLRPEATGAAVCGPAALPPSPVLRVLGARRLVQQALLLRPSRVVALAATGTDVLHGLSMLAAAVIWPRYRRAALTSAAVATASAALSAATAARAAHGARSALEPA